MTKEEVLKALDDAFIDYEIVGEHTDSFHILVKADEDEINDCITNVDLDKPNTYEDDDYKVSFKGTEYGDDSQVDIKGVK